MVLLIKLPRKQQIELSFIGSVQANEGEFVPGTLQSGIQFRIGFDGVNSPCQPLDNLLLS